MKSYLYIALFIPFISIGQNIDTSLFLQDVVIEGARISLPFSDQSRTIEIITAKEIAKFPSRDIAGILQYATGLDIRQRGPNGVQADIGIRGGGFEQSLILINGIKMTDPQTGHHIMNLPISPENIERIEIIKGPAARIYGQNAFAGAVNIITKTPDSFFGNVNLQAGQNQLLNLGVEIGIPGEKSNQYLSLNRSISEGYRYNTDYDITNILYQNMLEIQGHETMVFAGYSERKFGANGFYASANFKDQYEEVQTSIVGVSTKIINGSWTHKPKLYWRRNQDEYIFVRSNPSIYRNLHIGNNIGAEWNSSRTTAVGITGIGGEIRREHLVSSNLGERKRNLFSSYIEQRLEFGDFNLTPGVSFQYYSDFGPKFFYGVDAGYQFSSSTNLYANFGTTYRVPSYTDRFYTDPVNTGNPDLQPETAITYEVGAKKTNRYLTAQIAAFRRLGTDMIDWVRDTTMSVKWTPINLNNVVVDGIELSVSSNLSALTGVKLFGNQRISYSYLNGLIGNDIAGESRYLLENLRHQLIYNGNFNLGIVEASVGYRYYDRVSLENYNIVDLRLSKTVKKSKLYIDINNLFDVSYRETNLVEMPGRWVVAGAQFKIF